jgi:hypothetical protein
MKGVVISPGAIVAVAVFAPSIALATTVLLPVICLAAVLRGLR